MNFQSNSSISFEQMQRLISCIYDAALDENQWDNVLKTLAHTLHADKGSIRMLNGHAKDVQYVHTLNIDPCFTQSYIDHYIHIDPWMEILLKSNKTMFDCTHHVLTEKEYESLEYYQDFVIPQGHYYGIGGKININNESTCYISFQREKKRQGFETNYLDMLYALVPHIQKAALINKKTRALELEKNSFGDSLNQINIPVILANKNSEVLFINSEAEKLIKEQSDISIINNNLYIQSQKKDKLQNLIYNATRNTIKQGGAMCHTDSVTRSSISILVTPVNPDMININTPDSENALIVLSTNQQKKALSIELLTGLYKLSQAEARLTMNLCHGLTLEEISEELKLSKNTLKSQLRSSFTKTGTSRQAELINMINVGPAGIIKAT